MSRSRSDHDLLFGILALQNGFIEQPALIAAFHVWTLEKRRPLAEILQDRGALSAARRELLEALVSEHIRQHGDDPEQSLAALSSSGGIGPELAAVGDADLQASLARVGGRRPEYANPLAVPGFSSGDAFRTLSNIPVEPAVAGARFRIVRPHARGGLGEVYVALDAELNREVALKQIQDQHADLPESRSRFVLEAEITGGLEHPGIVPVYSLGHDASGRPYYAMRFIRGDSLRDAVAAFHKADGPGRDPGERLLALQKLLRRFLDVCNAIAYAHSRGVLHRDLKPGNIMVGQYGETLVVDWGLAKVVGTPETSCEATLRPPSASGTSETLPGSAIGTPAYMSPEQAAGELHRLGPASDVYSLGATLYSVLTGKAPFEKGEAADVLSRVQRGEFPPPRQVQPNVPRALEAICLKAMALRPADRYPNCRALSDDIERWLADEPVSAWLEPWPERLSRWGRRHRSLVATAAAILGTATVGLATGLWVVNAERARTELAR
jgi:serine/threonine-protein kinase